MRSLATTWDLAVNYSDTWDLAVNYTVTSSDLSCAASLSSNRLCTSTADACKDDMSLLAAPSREVVLNVGHWRTGTTTLAAAAAESAGFAVYRKFPEVTSDVHRMILVSPQEAVKKWWFCSGKSELIGLLRRFDFICDGWIPLLPFLDVQELIDFVMYVLDHEGINIRLIATAREVSALVKSELQHWVECDLERSAGLGFKERCDLQRLLHKRATKHRERITELHERGLLSCLHLELVDEWPRLLSQKTSGIEAKGQAWDGAFLQAGRIHQSKPLPMEAILLTFRLGSHRTFEAVELLLSSVAKDSLAQFFVVLALDSDEIRTKEATMMLDLIGAYCEVFLIANPPRDNNEPFSICQAWNNMAVKAFEKGADWVVLLGDDIEIDCPFHYRVTYRAFLDVSDRLGCSFGFGCPWWNDTSFPGFPTFPVVGKAHYEIFGSLIPSWRKDCFVSQDFDPYLQRLYLKFGAAPLMEHARLRNLTGGNNVNPTRYERIHAIGWRDWVLKDVTPLGDYLRAFGSYERSRSECLLLDVVIPSYRVDITFLRQICSLSVPDRLRTTFIVVVDNPTRLTSLMAEAEPCAAALALESLLVAHSKENTRSGNNIRVRCNEVNMGASATRNRGMDESSAEYILFLDDDVRPNADLLEQYEQELMRLEDDVVGLVGMVRFPRSKDMSVLHAAVLMSYLTFMFEIAANEIYAYPAWGVTANLLVKRLEVRFDTVYAKTGGGEDVDFCLRLLDSSGGRLKSVRGPMVHHAVWPGGFRVLLPHFFHWAVGDGALFQRYTGLCYTSWPNIVETFVVFALCWIVFFRARGLSGHVLIVEALGLFFADFAVEVSNPEERRHKQRLLEHDFSCSYYAAAHLLANLYVVVLECGRLYGHVRRRELLSNACRRFDWHCERLAGAPAKFRRKERTKFLLFLVVTAANLVASSPGLVRKIRRACPVFSSNPGAGEL